MPLDFVRNEDGKHHRLFYVRNVYMRLLLTHFDETQEKATNLVHATYTQATSSCDSVDKLNIFRHDLL